MTHPDILAPEWHRRQVANELMAFQSRDFATQLIALYKEIYKGSSLPYNAQKSEARTKIEKLVLDYTGVNIDLHLDTEYPPCCMPLMANHNHILSTIKIGGMYHEQEKEFTDLIKSNPAAAGTFNPATGKLSGLYSKIKSPVYMSHTWCRANLSAEECAAVLMHEVGHCSLAYQFMFRTYRASQLLAALHHVRTGRDQSINYETAVKLAGEEICRNPKEFEVLLTMKDDKAISQVVYTRSWAQLGNDFGDKSVTGPNFEALSDNYSVRWGFAEHLATGLYNIYGDSAFGAKNRTAATVTYIVNTLKPVISGAALGSTFGGLPGMLIGAALMCILATADAGRGDGFGFQQANVYDTPLVRMERIREAVIEQLKVFKLSPDMRQTLLDELKTIESFTKNRKEVGSIFADIAMLIPSNWRAERAFKLERNLERLTQNDLFADAHELAARTAR